jgi:TetR/AcrR family transcriptional regulator, ethionamide resistance regulator
MAPIPENLGMPSSVQQVHRSFDFRKLLLERAGDEDLKKSVQTRLRLLASACALLEKTSYSDLKIGDVCEHAGMSHGIAYHYYKDKKELIADLIARFATETSDGYFAHPILETKSDPYLRIFDANAYYFRCMERNAGVFATLFSLRGDQSITRDALRQITNAWNRRIGQSIKGTFDPPLSEEERLLLGYALGGMADDLLGQLYAIRNPDLKAPKSRDERRRVCELLSILWYRAVYGKSPSKTMIVAARELF